MLTYQIKNSARKSLSRIHPVYQAKILRDIIGLSSNPFPLGYKKLKKDNQYRIRVGDYRVVYEIDKDHDLILIVQIEHRKDVYK